MSRAILSTLLLAAAVSAQSTVTSFWWPGTDDSTVSYTGAVIGRSGDKTTLAIGCDYDEDDCYYSTSETFVVAGNTYWQSTESYPATEEYGDLTVSAQCSVTASSARPICTISSGGLGALQEYCSDFTYSASYYSSRSRSYSGIPDFCSGSTLPESLAVTTTQLPRAYMGYHTVTITSGIEQLTATAAAASTTNGPSQTGKTTLATATATASGSGAAQNTGSANGTATGTAAPQQHTGAAAHLAAPVAGIAAVAMAAFAL